jgi:hypothetical protein
MWMFNMLLCCAIGFGGFGLGIFMMMKADERKKHAAKIP